MNAPVQIHYNGIDSSDALTERIREQAEKLEHMYNRIERIEVAIGTPHHQNGRAQRFHVRLRIFVPGNDVIIDRDPGDPEAHFDAHTAVRDAFQAAKRRLDEHADRMRPAH